MHVKTHENTVPAVFFCCTSVFECLCLWCCFCCCCCVIVLLLLFLLLLLLRLHTKNNNRVWEWILCKQVDGVQQPNSSLAHRHSRTQTVTTSHQPSEVMGASCASATRIYTHSHRTHTQYKNSLVSQQYGPLCRARTNFSAVLLDLDALFGRPAQHANRTEMDTLLAGGWAKCSGWATDGRAVANLS